MRCLVHKSSKCAFLIYFRVALKHFIKMEADQPSRQEIQVVFKKLRGLSSNKSNFFNQHGCSTTDAQQKYNSRAAQLYREKLHHAAIQAMRLHGTKLHLDDGESSQSHSPSPSSKEKDFFEEHSEFQPKHKSAFDRHEKGKDHQESHKGIKLHKDFTKATEHALEKSIDNHLVMLRTTYWLAKGNVATSKFSSLIALQESELEMKGVKPANGAMQMMGEGGDGPHLTSGSPSSAMGGSSRKNILGGKKKPGGQGLGGKRGLGAQRVATDFDEVQKRAEMLEEKGEEDKKRVQEAVKEAEDDQIHKLASMRLAYETLSMEQDKQKAKMDPKKAEQAERLGMGLGFRSGGVSHSAMTDMKTIDQDVPTQAVTEGKSRILEDTLWSPRTQTEEEDDFVILSSTGATSALPYASKTSEKPKSSWEKDLEERAERERNAGSSRRSEPITPAGEGDAVKKFANAKSISSDQFFGNSRDPSETSATSRFSGQSAISSDDYFGRETKAKGGSSSPGFNINAPDLDDVKESVRAGVTRVAGRLSTMANTVMSQLQVS
ncbi:unnamed protein product [Darwinula stevensoni]|uniref:ADP-ribosylation factor GTPase-activating protein 2 n=1 Tax=Darwinula stevensoni TaxID=69355 RepID=A0A7R8X5I7_9CRUS|nr:unnamed protein product [Darwinula stevensoni]CAG0887135.1 unnamed protein product [Darwinula stevensoni]